MVGKKANDNNKDEIEDTGKLTLKNHDGDNIVSDVSDSKSKTKSARSRSKAKKSKILPSSKKSSDEEKSDKLDKESAGETQNQSTRIEQFVEYDEPEFELKEVISKNKEILIGPRRLTRFEKARITGARALQLSFGAPIMIKVEDAFNKSSIALAIEELEKKALPISIRRILPNGLYQDIPLDWMTS